MTSLPIIDLRSSEDAVVAAIADAASTFGFFQVVGHGIEGALIDEAWSQTRAFFDQPIEAKRRLQRTKDNSRGYYDRELTKQARDLKEVLDLAHVPFPELADDDPRNFHAVDGQNQWPDLPGFCDAMVGWLGACESLSLRLLAAFARALDEEPDVLAQHFGPDHTSFVRLNHYPVADVLSHDEAADVTPLGDMALHHHSDAGALTVLMQDDIGGLQVEHDGGWIDVEPIAGAFVINTGDMMQVWSNDRFVAALHRVTSRSAHPRYSLPYFFNPSYSCDYAPLPGSITDADVAHYRSLNWGDFRQARADGDFADYGTEIQISQYRIEV
ncbi:MAG: 2OG-Fe(II) oxygenase family protein [Actinomycetota bacterium]